MTKRFLPFLLLAVSAVVLWTSCKKETDGYYTEPTHGFYPLGLGHYVIYDVDSITWNDFDCKKTTRHLQMRYTVADTFTDNAGQPSYRVDVEQRDNADSAWQVSQVFYVTRTSYGTSLTEVKQNLRMEKLIFPIAQGRAWLGNRGIDTTDPSLRQYSGWVYRYSNYQMPYDNGRIRFDYTVTVTAVNDSLHNPETEPESYAERNFFREVYAYNVGLVYREATYWTYDPPPPGSGLTSCRKGFSVAMRATQYRVR